VVARCDRSRNAEERRRGKPGEWIFSAQVPESFLAVNVFLISTYELGHQPFGLAEPAAWLRRAGAAVTCCDLAVQRLDEVAVRKADLIALYLPMHTATRIAAATLPRLRALSPTAHLCCYGLYAPVNAAYLRDLGVHTILGGEFETGLVSLLERLRSGESHPQTEPLIFLGKQDFIPPDRFGLPDLDRYAALHLGSGETRTAGYVEASRGCKHRCRHCPVVPVYDGRFRAVQREVVLGDIEQQVAAGARHITFGDPDFLNGPSHAVRIVRALHGRFPELTYDVTVKVEHLLTYAHLLPILKETGCLFVTTAVESVDDRVLEHLRKGHTRADFERVVALFDQLGLALAPTFVAFTPWTTADGYLDLLNALARLGLVDRVAPVQLAIRLLIPPGSRLLELEDVRELAGELDREALVHPWHHPDPRMDDLAGELTRIVEQGESQQSAREEIFARIWITAHTMLGAASNRPSLPELRHLSVTPPRLSEPWYCCAEPTRQQLDVV
jgi:radical SAM superfamily enzyme YgiQ (UPF0313 family)